MSQREPLPDQGSVTAEMVERGAIGLWWTYKQQRVSGSGKNTPLALLQGRSVAGWSEVAIKDWYRRRARAILEAALSATPDEEEQSHA